MMGRALVYGVATVTDGGTSRSVVVGTAHLESVTSASDRHQAERRAQMVECFQVLQAEAASVGDGATAVFMGDVNWTDPVQRGKEWDGAVPIPTAAAGKPLWRDVWLAAPVTSRKPASLAQDGFTYDAVRSVVAETLRY